MLAAFGGAGPLHAAALADELAMPEVLCPPIPGAFSALGLVGTDLKRDYVQTFFETTATADPAALEEAFAGLETAGRAMLDRARVPEDRRRFERSVDARYVRQSYELSGACRASHPSPPTVWPRSPRRSTTAIARPTATTTAASRCNSSTSASRRSATIPPLTIRDATAAPGTNAVKSRRPVWFSGHGERKPRSSTAPAGPPAARLRARL